MIELSANTAVMLYLGITLGILLSLWVLQNISYKRKKIYEIEQDLFVCEYCHFAYLEEGVKEVTQCPQCGSYNKHNIYRKK